MLEELEHAQARGAKIYAELIGYGVSSDANHITEPDPTGDEPGARDADGVRATPASTRPRSATSTRTAPRRRSATPSETRVIKLAVGEENAYKIPVSSTKGATGHCLGAAGAVEAIFTILATQRGVLPPTINYEVAGSGVRPRLHPERGARGARSQVGVSNSFGFGGHNACVVFRKLDDRSPSRLSL